MISLGKNGLVCSTAAIGRRWQRHRFAIECTVSNVNESGDLRVLKMLSRRDFYHLKENVGLF